MVKLWKNRDPSPEIWILFPLRICCQSGNLSLSCVSLVPCKDIKEKGTCIFNERYHLFTQLIRIYSLDIPFALFTNIDSICPSLFLRIKVSQFFVILVFAKWALQSV